MYAQMYAHMYAQMYAQMYGQKYINAKQSKAKKEKEIKLVKERKRMFKHEAG
jgi:hypothetical protein